MSTNGKRPLRILVYGDLRPSGFGRILRNVSIPLHANPHYEVMGVCIHYDGILPFNMTLATEDHVPFHVCGLSERDGGQVYTGYAQRVFNIWQAWQPDVIISAQDFPYHDALRQTPIDWSTTAHIVITPVDGAPVAQQWVDVGKQFDGLLTISEFGVEAMREGGLRAELCPPGVDTDVFKPLSAPERAQLRERMGIDEGAFVVGVMAMNQGRKNFPSMVRAFAQAYKDVPEAVLYLDTEKASPVGWDIPKMLMKPHGISADRVKFREDAMRAGLLNLSDRYNLLDLHMVVSEREGFGLPHTEALACGVPTVSLDYCSGREIVGDNERGWLVPAVEGEFGTWGGAMNKYPQREAFVKALREAYDKPDERKARGLRGLAWVRNERTWNRAAESVQKVLDRVIEKRESDLRKKDIMPVPPLPPMQSTHPAGMYPMMVFNGPLIVQGQNGQQVARELMHIAPPVETVESGDDDANG